MSNKPKRQRLQSLHLINVCVTVLTLIAVGVLALVLPKPTVSEVERRELAKKPEFTLESWFSGEFAQQYDAYYADTFPQREELVTMASKIESMEGIRPDDVRIYQANSSGSQHSSHAFSFAEKGKRAASDPGIRDLNSEPCKKASHNSFIGCQ